MVNSQLNIIKTLHEKGRSYNKFFCRCYNVTVCFKISEHVAIDMQSMIGRNQ